MSHSDARRARHNAAATSYVERLAQVTLALLSVGVAWLALRWVGPVLNPVLVSLVIAYFLDPVVDRFEERGVSRTLAIALLAAVALAGLAVVAAVVVPVVLDQISLALRELPAWSQGKYLWVVDEAQRRFGVDVAEQLRGVASLDGLAERAQGTLSTLVTSFVDSVASLLNLVLIPVFSFYFLRDFDTLKRRPLALVPPRYRDALVADATQMDAVVGDWLRGQVNVALVLAALYAAGLGAIGLRLGLFIGIIAGLLNIVPYLGAAIGVGLSVMMALMYGSVTQLVGVAVVFVVVQSLEGYFITPRLVGEKVGMSPLTVMLVLLLGGSLFGFFGMLLAIPAAAAGWVLARQWLDRYERSEFFVGVDRCEGAAVAASTADIHAAGAAAELGAESDDAAATEAQ
ncbi:MAG: AI-2E family transporter [Myxococcales bacterium]|nr:AI-2E family transporter [Myxococcales bacterium]MCB9530840.1 AI-2E family transporter [Myxococcales bacterium]